MPLLAPRRAWTLGAALAAATLTTGVRLESAHAALTSATRFVRSPDGVRIAYEVHGNGSQALVFVHGWSCDRSYWRGQVDAFAPHYTVVTLDLAGHGESGLGHTGSWSIHAFGGDVAAVVKHLRLTNVILIGHSMGGDVVTEAARQLPGRVSALIWVDTYKQLRTARSPAQVDSFVAPFRADLRRATQRFVRGMFVPTSDSALVERTATAMSSAHPQVAIGALESALGYSREIRRALAAIRLPVIAINADNAPTDTASLREHGVDVAIMHGVGHFMMLEDPKRFNDLLDGAITSLTDD